MERASEAGTSPGLLKRVVPLSIQYREMRAGLRDELTVSQHLALLPIADAEVKERLAREAVDEKLKRKELDARVRAESSRKSRGRTPRTELEKAVPAARRLLLNAVLEGELTAARLRALAPAVRARLLVDLRAIRERIERISDALHRVR